MIYTFVAVVADDRFVAGGYFKFFVQAISGSIIIFLEVFEIGCTRHWDPYVIVCFTVWFIAVAERLFSMKPMMRVRHLFVNFNLINYQSKFNKI